ncbi:MAG: hypothetical protein ACRDJG_06090 [Actinomycetota bacterium]
MSAEDADGGPPIAVRTSGNDYSSSLIANYNREISLTISGQWFTHVYGCPAAFILTTVVQIVTF